MPAEVRPKNLSREVMGLLFLSLALFLSLSLVTYSPNDSSLLSSRLADAHVKNLLGPVGSYVAGAFFALIGFSAFWIPVFLFLIGIRTIQGKVRPGMWVVVLGAGMFVLASSGLMALGSKSISIGGVDFPAHSVLGTLLSRPLGAYLGRFGAYLVLVTLILVSLMVCTRFSVMAFFRRTAHGAKMFWGSLESFAMKRRERSRKKKEVKNQAQRMRKEKPRVREAKAESVKPFNPPEKNIDFTRMLPSLSLMDDPPPRESRVHRESLEMNSRILEKKLLDFGVQGHVEEVVPGPVITMYEFKPAPGIKISKVAGLADDLALALRAESIRVVAPIPGKGAIGIEIPNSLRETVYLKEVLGSEAFLDPDKRLTLGLALGKDIMGYPVAADLSRMPHLLIAGATGSGKSVCLNTMILSLLYGKPPEELRFLMVDPKRIELSVYEGLPHLLHPVVTNPKKATMALRWAVKEMERRYRLLSELGVRGLDAYNKKLSKRPPEPQPVTEGDAPEEGPLPYIVVVIDELADLMMVASKDVEESIARLAQMARAAGIHLVLATQRPSVDVLTGVIKANFPTRISFQVSSKTDSRTILDANGAEKLLGAGDMLYVPPGTARIQRIHGAFVSDMEIKRVADYLRKQSAPDYTVDIPDSPEQNDSELSDDDADEKYEEAVRIVLETRQASISMLQRRLRVGYNRAARMIELMERQGIVGPSDGVKPREVRGIP